MGVVELVSQGCCHWWNSSYIEWVWEACFLKRRVRRRAEVVGDDSAGRKDRSQFTTQRNSHFRDIKGR